MRIALVSAPLAVARELRERGHDVTLLVPQVEGRTSTPPDAAAWGFPWIPVGAARLIPADAHFPQDATLATARALADLVPAFDLAWFFEAHWAMPALRDRRFRDHRQPAIVVERAASRAMAGSLEDMNRVGSEQYALQHADAVSPTVELVERLENPKTSLRQAKTSPAVTVCIPYFEAPETLPRTLESLERQTSNDFTVTVVDDGSYTPAARQAFKDAAARYAGRGWKFLTQTNQYPGAARNHAAREASTEFLIFIDADDIAMPNLVERFLRAALLTGDDCLVIPNYGFHQDPAGPCVLLYEPPGALLGSMADDMHGGSCFLVRREAFEKIGGFTEIRGVGFEDYEFHVRCHLAGLRWDVLPEFLYRYRMPRAGGVSRSTIDYQNHARVRRHYEERLAATGLRQLPLALASAYQRIERARAQMRPVDKPSGSPLRLLMVTCYFPYGMMSGWHRRVQEMIRYFGSRYQVTLVTQMTREQLAPVRKEALRHLHGLRGVEGSNRSGVAGEDLPERVLRQTTDTLREALQALPTGSYHAALIDQVFLAELRRDIETLTLLTEHNVESRLLHQAGDPAAASLERYEDHVWPCFPLRAVVSEADRAQMSGRVSPGRTVVAPNGAHPSAWLPRARRDAATVLFPAHLAYPPNVDAVQLLLEDIWPRVRRQNPRARLILAGRDPAPSVRAAAARAEGVELCVNPPSMDKVAERACLTVAPLRQGSGTRCKILESLAWGLPVVSTTLGAEGIDALDGVHLLLRDQPEAFAEAIGQLLADEALWQRLRHAGRDLVRERYSWDKVFEPLEDALLELIP